MANPEEQNARGSPKDSVFYERCWRCRCVVPNGLVRRRTLKTGYSHGTHIGTGAAVTSLEHYETVSLCGVCDNELGAIEKARLEKGGVRLAWVCRFFGILLGTRFLNLVCVPLPLGAVIMLILARLRIVGRSLLVFWGLAIVLRVLGWEPQQHPERIGIPWAVITSGIVLWRIWTADSLLWPFDWLARKRPTSTVKQMSSESAEPLTIGGNHS